MFRASLCPSLGEQRPYYRTWCTALVLLDVVGSGCGALRCRMRAVLASYKHIETVVDDKHLIVASCWFSLSSHFAHDARSREPKVNKVLKETRFDCTKQPSSEFRFLNT